MHAEAGLEPRLEAEITDIEWQHIYALYQPLLGIYLNGLQQRSGQTVCLVGHLRYTNQTQATFYARKVSM